MQLFGRRYDTNQLVRLTIAKGCVVACEVLTEEAHHNSETWPWIAPAFVDLQHNGYAGRDFTSASLSIDDVVAVAMANDAFGCCRFLPTLTTNSFERLAHSLNIIAQACEGNAAAAARIAGIHLEGPYISAEEGARGAHPLEQVRPPNFDEFQRLQSAARGKIKLLTVSPEYENSAEFIRECSASGVIIAIGHTAANSQQIKAAVDAGARMSTHLGNGAHRMLRRHPNYLWAQLADDRLVASLIVDGHHLPREVVQTFVRAKTPRRCVLVSDLTALAGLPAGDYRGSSLGDVEVLTDGRLVIAGQRELLAGASLPIGAGVANVMDFAGVNLETAVNMASRWPAEIIGTKTGGFAVGESADFVTFDLPREGKLPPQLPIRSTIIGGEVVWKASAS